MLFALFALGLFAALLPHAASADDLPVTFAGEVDSDGPLVIDPSASDDPVTLPVSASAGGIYFIERMPQTKSVTNITIGDYGQDNCSSSTPTVRLYVVSHDNGDYNGSGQQVAYTNEIPLPATPSRLSFSFDWVRAGGSTLLMGAGKTYTFSLGVTGCSTFKQTTWAPLEPRMETPNHTCVSAMPFGENGGIEARMQWHDSVTNQPDSACVTWMQQLWPYEPDGWLVAIEPGWAWYISHIENISGPDPNGDQEHYCDRQRWPGQNVSQVDVMMPTGFPDMQLNGVCRWNSFYPPGQQTRYTWSTALPWREETGAGPRMPYLKLDTVDWDNSLLQQYSPAIKNDSNEGFLPEDARGIASIAPSDGDCSGDRNGLSNRRTVQIPDTDSSTTVDTRYADAGSSACPAQNQLRMQDLGAVGTQYPFLVDGQHPTVTATDDHTMGDHLSERGSDMSIYLADSRTIFSTPGWGSHVYGRAFQGANGELWLQYFFWYYYNDGGTVIQGIDDHEGDWEGIQIHIPTPFSNPVPDYATYNEHSFRSVCGWNLVEQADGHPVVYVSAGRHASYFTPEKMPSESGTSGDGTDATPLTPSILPHVEPITAFTPNWIRWPGRWGDSTGDFFGAGKSPTGPTTFHLWKDPVSWDSDSSESGMASDVACPDVAPSAARMQAEKVGARQLRTHKTTGDGLAPTVTWKRLADGRIRVHWKLPKTTDPDQKAVKLQLGIHTTEVLNPASVVYENVTGGRRQGTATLDLPAPKGPYELVVRIIQHNGEWSDEATSPIPAG